MECKRIKEKLSAFIDNELEEKKRLEIEQHLADCPVCNQEVKVLTQAWNALEVWKKIRASDSFEARFWQRVREREQRQFLPQRLFRRIVQIPVPVAAAIVLVIGLLLGNYLGNILYPKETKAAKEKINFLYLDNFKDLPPESIGGVYISLVSQGE
ncbi:MAG TPA: hypothetical protein EYP60_03340 [bacterium (Candidatus Stahlbacteria)]|nr:hypothetical protein [Candidatus Stahlbacteria bacterium]